MLWVPFSFYICSSFLLCACITVVIRNKVITKINVVLLNYFGDKGQEKKFFMSPNCFIFKKKEVFPVSIYLETARSNLFL